MECWISINMAIFTGGTLANFTNVDPDVCYLNGYPMPFFPNSLTWDYTLNTASFDTIGGRVVQVLSIAIESVTLQGDAGNRANLQLLYVYVNGLQNTQISTQVSSSLVLPSRNWSFNVWVHTFPAFGWDYETVTYPYQLTLEVDQNYGVPDELSQSVVNGAFADLQDNIGFNSTWNGLNSGTGQQGADQSMFTEGSPLTLPPISSIQTELNNLNNASGSNGT